MPTEGTQPAQELISKCSTAGMARKHFDSQPRGAYNTALGRSGSIENRLADVGLLKIRKAR